MWVILSTTGLYQIRLADLKFHTNVKGWKCNMGKHVYNYLMHDETILSDSICRANTDYKIETFDKPVYFKETMFTCPKTNCYCGMDIGIPKGKTEKEIILLREEFFKVYPNISKLKWYDDSGEILAFGLSDFLLNELVHLDWFIGKRCNFDCSYCSDSIHDNFSEHKTLDQLIESFHFLERTIGFADRRISIIFHGGEPTLNPNFLEFVSFVSTYSNIEILTLTNLTRNEEYLYELNKLSNITYSVHLAYLTEKFLAKAEKFFAMRDDSSLDLTVKTMYLPIHKDKIKSLLETVQKYPNIKYSITPLHRKDSKELYDYSEDDKKFFKIVGKT